MLQTTVRRHFATGMVGEILNDGPLRVKPARITSDGSATPNRVGRAFTYSSEKGTQGSTFSAIGQEVVVGGSGAFFGLLSVPKHYALFGTNSPASGEQGGALSPTIDLPQGSEGEFADMAIMVATVANGNDSAQDLAFGAQIYYAVAAVAASTGVVATTAADIGRLYAFGDTSKVLATQFKPVPNARLMLAALATASGADVLTKIQLTQ